MNAEINADGVSAAVAPNAFTKTGYTFSGWNTEANGTGTSYANGATYLFVANVTLYAQWTINSYAVTYANGGGSGTAPTQANVNYGATFSVASSSLTKTGYTFAGWSDGTTTYQPGSTYIVGASGVTLSALWTINSYSVTFSANGGVGSMSSETENYNVMAALTLNAFTKTGYTFSGWNTAANGTGTSYANGATYLFVANVTLYAQWTNESSQFQTSSNWAGYVLNGGVGGYQAVSGQWTVPTLNCQATPEGITAVWVGVNGVNSGRGLFQDGTTSSCANGVETSYAWWTDEALGYESQSVFDVNRGDVIYADVTQTSSGMWEYDVSDITTGAVSNQVEAYSGTGTSAEWIVEDPGMTNGGLYPFADFGAETITDLGLTVPSGSWTLPTPSDGVALLAADGTIAALPGPFTGSGASAAFTVTYQTPS